MPNYMNASVTTFVGLKILAIHRRAVPLVVTSFILSFCFGRNVSFLLGICRPFPFDYNLAVFEKFRVVARPTTFLNSMPGLYAGTCLFSW